MARANQRDTEIRRALETIGTEIAVIEGAQQFAHLRVRQAQDRTGLSALLGPALDEIDEIKRSVSVVRDQVSAALARLTETNDARTVD